MHRRFLAVVAALAALPLPAAAAPGRDTIMSGTAGFHAEHAALLGTFAERMERAVAPGASRWDRASLVLFLRSELESHAQAEEEVLYPALENVLGTRGYATATMVLDHQAIAQMVDSLRDAVATGDIPAFQRHAYALQGLVGTHFGKEEAFILPALRERMTEAQLQALLGRMGVRKTS